MIAEGSHHVAAIRLLPRGAESASGPRQQIQEIHRRLVAEQPRDRWARPDDIPCMHDEASTLIAVLGRFEVRREHGGAARGTRIRAHRGLEIAVKIVETEELQVRDRTHGGLRVDPSDSVGRGRPRRGFLRSERRCQAGGEHHADGYEARD